jgi:hypothetical protein
MLFIMVMDVPLFSKASADGVLEPLGHPAIKHQCSLYADDAILLEQNKRPEITMF